ncbi:hypothetical protein Tco_0251598 [Tanacetum coccineum]
MMDRGAPNLAKRDLRNLQTTRASLVASAFCFNYFDRPKESGIKDLFGGEICTVDGTTFAKSANHGVPHLYTVNTQRANDPRVVERKCFRDFLSRGILMRVLKVWKDDRAARFSAPFLFGWINLKFFGAKDPPHQSWLSILFSEEILYSRMVGMVVKITIKNCFEERSPIRFVINMSGSTSGVKLDHSSIAEKESLLRKEEKENQQSTNGVKVGDEVETIGS